MGKLTTLQTLTLKHTTDLLHKIAPAPKEPQMGLFHSQIIPSLLNQKSQQTSKSCPSVEGQTSHI